MRKVLVTGAAGLLGQHLVNHLRSAEIGQKDTSILVMDKADNPFEHSDYLDYLQADLISFDSIKSIIEDFKPDFIFNCAAYTDVDGCEKNKKLADALNVHLVKNLLELQSFKKIIHFSTDYVFNGFNGPYTETDDTDPVGYYGLTKLQSERLLQNSQRHFLIIRTNVLYGTGKNVRPNFITWLIDNLRRNKNLRIITDQLNNPTYAGNLAQAAVEAAQKDYTGVLHVAGADYISRYQIALKTAFHFNLNSELIMPISTDQLGQKARRPLRGGLKITKAQNLLKTKLIGLDEGLKLMGDY
jgi:dTDP-4-dehydrorhamnose reductase